MRYSRLIERQISKLPGMRDVTATAYESVRGAIDALRPGFEAGGFAIIDTPLLEETELFVRKSGGEISSRLYTFTDPGGYRVSLRPEFTSSVIRHFVQEVDQSAGPVRWYYHGPVFRYEATSDGSFHQFMQVGAEVIGETGPKVEAEVIVQACAGFASLGLKKFELRIGHLGLLYEVLSGFGLSEPAKLFVAGNVQALKNGETNVDELVERATDVGLLRSTSDGPMAALPQDVSIQTAQQIIEDVMGESLVVPAGLRSTEHIVARLLRKVRDANDPGTFSDALRLVNDLAALKGTPQEVLSGAKSIVESQNLDISSLTEVEELISLVQQDLAGDVNVVLDFGLARGISYYTGVVFEMLSDIGGQSTSLGGGGRYDDLVRSLGGLTDTPALGFAYNLDQVLELLNSNTIASQNGGAGA